MDRALAVRVLLVDRCQLQRRRIISSCWRASVLQIRSLYAATLVSELGRIGLTFGRHGRPEKLDDGVPRGERGAGERARRKNAEKVEKGEGALFRGGVAFKGDGGGARQLGTPNPCLITGAN